MKKRFAPVVLVDEFEDGLFAKYESDGSYRPIDLDTGSILNRVVTLWEHEKSGLIVGDIKKFEKFLKSLKE